MASRDERPADKKSVPSDIRKLHCLGKHFPPTRIGPVSVPPSGASAATFSQAPEGTCPCPWRLPLLSKPTVLLCGFPVTPGHPNSEATCRPGAAPPRDQPPSTRPPCHRPKASAVSARLFGACPSSGRNRSKNSPACHSPPPCLQGRNPGSRSTAHDRRRLRANLRLPLGTRASLSLSQNRATRNSTRKMGVFLVEFASQTLSIIATSLLV